MGTARWQEGHSSEGVSLGMGEGPLTLPVCLPLRSAVALYVVPSGDTDVHCAKTARPMSLCTIFTFLQNTAHPACFCLSGCPTTETLCDFFVNTHLL